MKINTMIAATMAVAGVAAAADHTSRELIVGGTVVGKGMKPHVGGLRTSPSRRNYCGCALIKHNIVITTAACASLNLENYPIYASLGSNNVRGQKDGEQIKVVKVQNHPKYDMYTGIYNFALLTLERSSKYKPIDLPNSNGSDTEPGMWLTVFGWGSSNNDQNYSQSLLSVNMPVYPYEDCFQGYDNVNEANLCAGGVTGYDICNGDQGNPLTKVNKLGGQRDILIGLADYSCSCGKDEAAPSLYVRVDAVLDWIKSII